MAGLVAALSAAYNAGEKTEGALPARLAFSFPRDVPKSAGAVRELVSTGALTFPAERPLRILDLGAGLGASTWGVILALAEASDAPAKVEAMCVDDDRDALSVAEDIVTERRDKGRALINLTTLRSDLARPRNLAEQITRRSPGSFDVVVLGQVLCEIESISEETRLDVHVELVRVAGELTAPTGSVVIIEPALRERTRRLHAVRDAILASSPGGLRVFAPCVHQALCPALADPNAWCHEDLDVDLPGWLVPVARAAGLRWQGLTFSYLVLRKDGRSIRDGVSARALLRVVSEPIVTKGKRELFVCGDHAAPTGLTPLRSRAMRLDRDANPANAAWEELLRGDVLECEPPLLADRPRIGRDSAVRRTTR
jgi:ribosomal protein RSM22 (predicted rRNA methylase)